MIVAKNQSLENLEKSLSQECRSVAHCANGRVEFQKKLF